MYCTCVCVGGVIFCTHVHMYIIVQEGFRGELHRLTQFHWRGLEVEGGQRGVKFKEGVFDLTEKPFLASVFISTC